MLWVQNVFISILEKGLLFFPFTDRINYLELSTFRFFRRNTRRTLTIMYIKRQGLRKVVRKTDSITLELEIVH